MLFDQGWSSPTGCPGAVAGASERPEFGPMAGMPEQKGRLSIPVQRRLSEAEIDELIYCHGAGTSIAALARCFEVHRTTVIVHLERAGLARRGWSAR